MSHTHTNGIQFTCEQSKKKTAPSSAKRWRDADYPVYHFCTSTNAVCTSRGCQTKTKKRTKLFATRGYTPIDPNGKKHKFNIRDKLRVASTSRNAMQRRLQVYRFLIQHITHICTFGLRFFLLLLVLFVFCIFVSIWHQFSRSSAGWFCIFSWTRKL